MYLDWSDAPASAESTSSGVSAVMETNKKGASENARSPVFQR